MERKIHYCCFCGKSSKEVKKMIGSTINDNVICESCIAACYNMIASDVKEKVEAYKNKCLEELHNIQDEAMARTTKFINELHRTFGQAEQTQIEATKILKKLQTNLGKPEMLERAKEQLEIAIDMLDEQKQDKNSQK